MVQTRSGKRVEFPRPDPQLQWQNLPDIVQDLVLEELAQDYNRYLLQDRQCRASYAAVSLQWQKFFEKLNFDKLVLRPSALRRFRKIVKRRSYIKEKEDGNRRRQKPTTDGHEFSPPSRMPPIRHIWLHVDNLQVYDCGSCKGRTGYQERSNNNSIFTKSLYTLLRILSGWEERDPNHKQELTLELSAQSLSDSRHCFQGDAGLQPDYPHMCPVSTQRDYILRYRQGITSGENVLNDPAHFYSAGRFPVTSSGLALFPQLAAERVIRPLEFDFAHVRSKKNKFPRVRMISTFLVRRQFYRELSPPAFGQLLDEALIGLRNIRYERWRLPDLIFERLYDMEFGPTESSRGSIKGISVTCNLPRSLEVLSLFEDRTMISPIPESMSQINPDDAAEIRCSPIRVLEGLAGRAFNLKHLSVSVISDAIECFKFPADAFPNLLSLSLTSRRYLRPGDGKARKILLRAAMAVRKLPKLQIMELWNCEKGHAAILRYETAGAGLLSHTCGLTWRSSWDSTESTIGTRVKAAWEDTAWKASRQLIIKRDPLPRKPYVRYGEILHHLKLRSFILDPVSIMQARAGLDAENQPEVPVWKESVQYSPGRKAAAEKKTED